MEKVQGHITRIPASEKRFVAALIPVFAMSGVSGYLYFQSKLLSAAEPGQLCLNIGRKSGVVAGQNGLGIFGRH